MKKEDWKKKGREGRKRGKKENKKKKERRKKERGERKSNRGRKNREGGRGERKEGKGKKWNILLVLYNLSRDSRKPSDLRFISMLALTSHLSTIIFLS